MQKGCDIGAGGSSVLLSQDDPPAFAVENEGAAGDFLLVCDHAGRRVPQRLGSLGLPAEAFERHIAWDIGAATVTRCLSRRLGVAAVLQTYSRLVIDCNRQPGHEDWIPAGSDGVEIPGNAALPADAAQARFSAIFEPYHLAIQRRLARGGRPTLVSIHSFTPELGGVRRPWRFGVLHDGRSRFSDAALTLLRGRNLGPVGDNQPYAMDGTDFTVPHHAMRNGLDYLELEIRQDLIVDPSGADAVAIELARLLPQALRLAAAAP